MTVPWKYGTQDAQAYADHVAECRVEECVICAGVKPVCECELTILDTYGREVASIHTLMGTAPI